jgi:hypothetical protein
VGSTALYRDSQLVVFAAVRNEDIANTAQMWKGLLQAMFQLGYLDMTRDSDGLVAEWMDDFTKVL